MRIVISRVSIYFIDLYFRDGLYLDKGRRYFYLIVVGNQKQSSSQMFYKISFLKRFSEKHLRQSLFSIKLQDGGMQVYLKGGSNTDVFL